MQIKSNKSFFVLDHLGDFDVAEVDRNTLRDTYVTIPVNVRKGESTVITEDTTVLGMEGMSTLTIFPQYLDQDICNNLLHSILNCGCLRQYQRSGKWDEPLDYTLSFIQEPSPTIIILVDLGIHTKMSI